MGTETSPFVSQLLRRSCLQNTRGDSYNTDAKWYITIAESYGDWHIQSKSANLGFRLSITAPLEY